MTHLPPPAVIDHLAYLGPDLEPGGLALIRAGRVPPLVVSRADYPGVARVAGLLQADLQQVSGNRPALICDTPPAGPAAVLIGTLGHSPLIDRLAAEGWLAGAGLAGRRESFLLQVVARPLPGLEQALVIAGSDKRGTLYGMLDLATQSGVSPWAWWADVPVARRAALFIRPGAYRSREPAVRYRGFFINDEEPALGHWAQAQFGGLNHAFYQRVFELLLRLRGNFLWPAMWGKAFYDDDPLNGSLADEYGIVVGTSHHEPLGRAHDEWRRYGVGPWNYTANAAALQAFWRERLAALKDYEVALTLGMRGDGDLPLGEAADSALLRQIIADQRQLVAEVVGREPPETPQVWALYKEVQRYYDHGLEAPGDVTLLLCDDNWGNVRRLPEPGAPPRAGGYGMYYHFDYVGGPRNYKWINTSPLARVREQMHLTHAYGVDRLWIVNVGDIKPLEFPLQFFLDYAWNPAAWPAERLPAYARQWAAQQFGPAAAAEIAELLTRYTRYNGRRKPELLAPDTYSLVNYHEAETVVAEYNALAERARRLGAQLAPEYQAAYYQLVLFPILAGANLNELYVTVGRNRLYARQGRAALNALADRARALFARDAELTREYNETLSGGKWRHFMDQTHIGYTGWQQPAANALPAVETRAVPAPAEMGVAIEGAEACWPAAASEAVLPEFDAYHRPTRFIEIFNRGQAPFDYRVESGAPWLKVTPAAGRVEQETRLTVRVDWDQAPLGRQSLPLTLLGSEGSQVTVRAVVHNPATPRPAELAGFVEADGYVALEAEHYARAVAADGLEWQRLPDFGRTLSAMTSGPVTAPRGEPGGAGPRLEYDLYLFSAGLVRVRAYLAPTIDFRNAGGLCYAVSFDDQAPQIVNLHSDSSLAAWEQAVSDNLIRAVSRHTLAAAGAHVLKFWRVDPGVVLERLVVETGPVRPSYLGPPESFRRPAGEAG